MHFLFLNQYFPPDPAPTGILLRELGDHLAAQGHTMEFVSSAQDYRAAKKGSRMLREFSALASIFFRGVRARHADVVISASSPPCLLVVAAFISMVHRAKCVHWAMDLYPDLAVALGEVKPGLVPTVIERVMGWAYRRCSLVVALDEDMAARLRQHRVEPEIIPPWVLASFPIPEGPVAPIPEWTWMYSGNLGRAHEWETLLQAQAVLEKRSLPCRLVFQGGGPSWPLAQARAKELGLLQCDWKNYAPEEELATSLLQARALVITQKPETQGLLWPSKLALAISLQRPILWVGPADGAIANTLRKLPSAGIFPPGAAESVADWLEQLHRNASPQPQAPAAHARSERDAALQKWAALLA